MARERNDDVHAQCHQRQPNRAFHHPVDESGELFREHDGRDAEYEDHGSVTERIHRRKADGTPSLPLRTGDVGDGREVVPVDPVPEPEREGGDEHAHAECVA